VTLKAPPGHHWCGSTSAAAPWPPIGAPLSSLPLHRLDRDPIGRPRGHYRFPPTRFGVFPFLCTPLQGRKGSRGGKEGAVRHTIADALLLEADRGEGVPDQAPRGRGRPHRDEKAGPGTERGAGRHREHLHNAALFVKPATTTPLPRCENLGFPHSLALLEPLTPCLWACLRATVHRVRLVAIPPWASVMSRCTGANPAPWPPQAVTPGAPNSWATC
jgi:hypothetical protein